MPRAKRWLIFIAIPGILIMLALGAWQVQRLMWKNETNAFRQARAQSEAIALPASVEDIPAMLFRPVWLEGRFQHDMEMFLAARSYRSNPGYHVITPFERSDGSVLLVNRGWIPVAKKDPATRTEGQIEGVVRIEGLLNSSVEPGWMTPENLPQEKFWYWLDMPSLSAEAGIEPRDYLIDAGPAANPGGFPIGGQTKTELRNSHVQYVVTWFALAATLGVITFLMFRGARRRAAQPTEQPNGQPNGEAKP
ncbi:MAG: SURF1 family protein [Rhodospirillaceae bacterium]|nr:SURF1 family protein [Rhodospirillaceae bacterium]